MALLRDERFIKIFLQVVFVAIFFTGVALLAQSVSYALAANNLSPSFQFLGLRAGFNIGGVVAPLIFGWLMDAGHPSAVFLLGAAFMLLTALAAALPETRRRAPSGSNL